VRPARLQLDTSPLTQAIYSALCIAGAPTPGPAPPLQTELWSQTPGRARACARAVCALRRSAHALAAALAADKNLNQERAGLVRHAGARAGRNHWKLRQPSPLPPDSRPQPSAPLSPRHAGVARPSARSRPAAPRTTPHQAAAAAQPRHRKSSTQDCACRAAAACRAGRGAAGAAQCIAIHFLTAFAAALVTCQRTAALSARSAPHLDCLAGLHPGNSSIPKTCLTTSAAANKLGCSLPHSA